MTEKNELEEGQEFWGVLCKLIRDSETKTKRGL